MERFDLRNYQKTALTVIYNDLKTQKNVLLNGIVGSGKTLMFCRLVERYYKTSDKRFLLLMHKNELIQQTYKTFLEQTDIPEKDIGVSCASLNKKQTNRRVTIGSVQTFANQVDAYFGCDLLIIDEIHRATIGTGSQYDQIIDSLRAKTPNMRLFGCTSTPYRLSSGYIYGDRCKPGTINLFPKINHKITYAELLKQDYLMPLQGQVVFDEQLTEDLNNIDKADDYVLEQLGQVMSKQIHIKTAVDAIKAYANDYKHICVFACTIDHAEQLQEAINIEYSDQVTIVHSKLTQLERASNMNAWKTGRKRIMVSINILVEGFDFPPLDCLVMARPTKSAGLYLQAIGRVLRIADGKEKALLIDLTTNTQDFSTDLDNIKVVIPKSAAKQGKKKNEKYCPGCDTKVHIVIRTCPKCGYKWTIEENEKIIAKQMPELKQVLFKKKEPEKLFPDVPLTWYRVIDMTASIHSSKKNDNLLGKISLQYCINEYQDGFINVFICMPDFYSGYAVEKAKATWEQFSIAPFPENVEQFQDAVNDDALAQPTKVLLDQNGQWPELKDISFDYDDIKIDEEYEDDVPF